jgi:phage repressor protein C with HTH and peptisase S24 domain
MKTIDEIRRENLAFLIGEYGKLKTFADKIERSSSQVSQWLNGSKHSESGKPRRFNSDSARYIEKMCGKPEGWMDQERLPLGSTENITFLTTEHSPIEVGHIEYWDIRGSCGGGVLTFDEIPKGKLIKEASFFKKYNIKPENAFSIYADGDSMAEFIVDGDMCIFDRSRTEPVSGKIFAIQHPDGLRIKVLRRSIDGTWTLESKNQDKRRYPDEVIPPSHADLLKIVGQFIYRQGG